MKVTVLKDACIGCGACQSICPDVFELGDDGFAAAYATVNNENKDDVVDASESCPTGAINIEEKEAN